MKSRELFFQYEKEVAQFKIALIQRLSAAASVPEEPQKKRTTNLVMIEAALVAAGKPLHVTEIIAAIEKELSSGDSILNCHHRDVLERLSGSPIKRPMSSTKTTPLHEFDFFSCCFSDSYHHPCQCRSFFRFR